jgi:NADPH:quinone reductase-like Zn-dependent oxidoreductase
MKLRYKVATGVVVLFFAGMTALTMILSHSADCPPAPEVAEGAGHMKAVVYRCYGSPDVLNVETIAKPVPGDEEILVKVKAASINPLDWHYLRGLPYFLRMGSGIGKPTDIRLGVDFAGTVESVGANVTLFQPGDDVFGGAFGAYADYLVMNQSGAVVRKPAAVSFDQAASLPIAAVTALQALRDKGNLKEGQKVLVNGASGGVGTFAVQIAKSLGAEVHGVCSTRNVDMVRSLGADHVFDYKKEDYTRSGQKYDLILDMVSNHSLSANRDALTPNGILVIVGGPSGNWLTPMIAPLKAMLMSPFVDQEMSMILARMNKADLTTLGELTASGTLTPVIERKYPLGETADALRHSEAGHVRGKLVISL